MQLGMIGLGRRGANIVRRSAAISTAGPNGAGNFVKMIHNGIEYGMMQAFAEGFDILKNANSPNVAEDLRLNLNLADVAEVWRRGSVVSSWLLDLIATSLAEDGDLAALCRIPAKAAGP